MCEYRGITPKQLRGIRGGEGAPSSGIPPAKVRECMCDLRAVWETKAFTANRSGCGGGGRCVREISQDLSITGYMA